MINRHEKNPGEVKQCKSFSENNATYVQYHNNEYIYIIL